MIQAHIMDGDLVFVRKQETAGSGDIVAAMLDGEATVKRFTRESGAVVLRPEHPTMKPIVVEAGQGEFRILGKVVGVMRHI
jgi:repressor LexA